MGAAANCGVVAVGGGGGVATSGGSAYFLSPEQLEAGKGTPDQPNLYLAAVGSSPRYVTTLAPNDPVVLDSVKEATRRRTADFQVSASGDYSVFGTTLPLEPNYDNAGTSEIYRYDTASKALTCVSCDPTGVEPSFGSSLASNGLSLTEDGRVFFTSAEPLVARDQDHRKDAYEWEGGKIELISAGSSPFDSGLLSASASGRDIYFFTRDNLAPQDQNGPTMKIYDAREDGGFPYVPPAPLCAASDECHGAGTAPGPTTIRTVVGGPGNAEAEKTKKCKSGLGRKHGKCVRKPHRHHHKTAHRRLEQNRGGEK